MEVLAIQTFAVAEKKPENLSLPVEIVDAIRPLVERAGERRKWVVYSAALLTLLEQPEHEMRRRFGEVAAADQVGDFKALVERAAKSAANGDNDIEHRGEPGGASSPDQQSGRDAKGAQTDEATGPPRDGEGRPPRKGKRSR